MFDHPNFDSYSFDEVPLDRDIYLADADDEIAYHDMMVAFFDGSEYNYATSSVIFASADAVRGNAIEASWYPNTIDRYHEVKITIPRSAFVSCVGSQNSDEKPRIFVDSAWLRNLYARAYSTFAVVDVANMTAMLRDGEVSLARLIELRDALDKLAEENEEVLFLSFADSILLKGNWLPRKGEVATDGAYEPEKFIYLAERIDQIYREILGAGTYMVIAQGSNEYYNESLHHISSSGNHLSLNSIGHPFAVLVEIESHARKCIRSKRHSPSELYMDQTYLRSIRFKYPFGHDSLPSVEYPMNLPSNSGHRVKQRAPARS